MRILPRAWLLLVPVAVVFWVVTGGLDISTVIGLVITTAGIEGWAHFSTRAAAQHRASTKVPIEHVTYHRAPPEGHHGYPEGAHMAVMADAGIDVDLWVKRLQHRDDITMVGDPRCSCTWVFGKGGAPQRKTTDPACPRHGHGTFPVGRVESEQPTSGGD